MGLKEQDSVMTTEDDNGNTVIQIPITRKENVEGLEDALKEKQAFGDYVTKTELTRVATTMQLTDSA